MILDRKYIGNDVYASLDFKIYKLVFEHNYSVTNTNCFNNVEEAKNISVQNKFSILYDLNSTKYLMKDNFRYYIIEYPLLQRINAWKQTVSPTEELERAGLYVATGFTPIITQAPMDDWGGLVRTTLGEERKRVPVTYLDGIQKNGDWWYSIGMLCNAPSSYLSRGIPALRPLMTNQVSLWSAISETHTQFNFIFNNMKYSCHPSFHNSLASNIMTLIFFCS